LQAVFHGITMIMVVKVAKDFLDFVSGFFEFRNPRLKFLTAVSIVVPWSGAAPMPTEIGDV
jgi:hypothetical protein